MTQKARRVADKIACYRLAYDIENALSDFVREAVEAEREECAKVAEEKYNPNGFYRHDGNKVIAQAIRSRNHPNKKEDSNG